MGSEHLLSGINLFVPQGSCYGIYGETGSGKSLLLRMIYGDILPTSGEAFVLGLNVKSNAKRIRAQIGIVPQEENWEEELTVIENLEFFGMFQGLTQSEAKLKAQEVLRICQLEKTDQETWPSLDRSTKKQLSLARALINSPKILFLDHPVAGLPTSESQKFLEIVDNFVDDGGTVLFASSNPSVVHQIATDVMVLRKGQTICSGIPDKMVSDEIGKQVVEFSVAEKDVSYYIGRLGKTFDYKYSTDSLKVFIKPHQTAASAIEMIESENVMVRRPDIADVFEKLAHLDLRNKND